jgi:hypothetical protein
VVKVSCVAALMSQTGQKVSLSQVQTGQTLRSSAEGLAEPARVDFMCKIPLSTTTLDYTSGPHASNELIDWQYFD